MLAFNFSFITASNPLLKRNLADDTKKFLLIGFGNYSNSESDKITFNMYIHLMNNPGGESYSNIFFNTYVIYKDTPTYTLIVRNGRPYYYYHGRYYVHPPRYYYHHYERPHKPKPNCNGVPAPKPPRNSDVSRPSRPTNNGNKPHLSGNRNVRPRR
jgi:hypothetical protein